MEVIDDLENGKYRGEIVSFDSSPEGDAMMAGGRR